jgi:uncharacterized protein
MKIVVDTNILFVCISPRSSAHWLWQDILAGVFEVYVTTDILMEYAEIIGESMNPKVAEAAIDLLSELPNVHLIQKYYFWQLVEADPDDNKFVDCAIAVGANYLISNDKHLAVLKHYPYFNIQVLKYEEFKKLLGK